MFSFFDFRMSEFYRPQPEKKRAKTARLLLFRFAEKSVSPILFIFSLHCFFQTPDFFCQLYSAPCRCICPLIRLVGFRVHAMVFLYSFLRFLVVFGLTVPLPEFYLGLQAGAFHCPAVSILDTLCGLWSTWYQCCGSVSFWYGSGSGSTDLYLWLKDPDPDPAIFVSDLQDVNKKLIFSKLFCL